MVAKKAATAKKPAAKKPAAKAKKPAAKKSAAKKVSHLLVDGNREQDWVDFFVMRDIICCASWSYM